MPDKPKAPAKKAAARKQPAARKTSPRIPPPPDEEPTQPASLSVVRDVRAGSGRGRQHNRGGPSRDDRAAIKVALRRREALSLRLAGATNEQIAETLRDKLSLPDTYNADSARRDVRDSIEKLTDTPAAELRDEEIARARWYMRSMATQISRGEVDHITAALRIDVHVARLVGLYSPIDVQHTGPDGGPIIVAAAPIIDRDAAVAAARAALADVPGGTPAELPPADPAQ